MGTKLQVLYVEPGRAVECEGVCNLGGHPRPRLTHPVFFNPATSNPPFNIWEQAPWPPCLYLNSLK